MTARALRDRGAKAEEQWRRFGEVDPYYGVLTEDRYRRENLDEAAREAFFGSGQEAIDGLVARMQELGQPQHWTRAMDFGCGVGRLLVPLADRADQVVGVDVSPEMLAEARRSCEARGVDNVLLLEAHRLGELSADFDLITSYIVFQHIPSRTGYELTRRLTALLAPGGVAMLHFALTPGSALIPPFYWTLRRVPGARAIWNVMRKRARDYPIMEMNGYRLDQLLRDLHAAGIREVTIQYHPPPVGPSGRRDLTAFSGALLTYAKPPRPPGSA